MYPHSVTRLDRPRKCQQLVYRVFLAQVSRTESLDVSLNPAHNTQHLEGHVHLCPGNLGSPRGSVHTAAIMPTISQAGRLLAWPN